LTGSEAKESRRKDHLGRSVMIASAEEARPKGGGWNGSQKNLEIKRKIIGLTTEETVASLQRRGEERNRL